MTEATHTGLNDAFFKVRSFHILMGQPAPDEPVMQGRFDVNRRAHWVISEVNELQEAATIKDQADAYLDILYFALGGLVELGVVPDRMFDIVNNANMAKVWPDGTVRRRESDGKILKPDGWVAPEPALQAEIERQISEKPLRLPEAA